MPVGMTEISSKALQRLFLHRNHLSVQSRSFYVSPRELTLRTSRNLVKMVAQKPRILFFNPVRHALAAFEALSKVAQVEVVASRSRQEFFKDIEDRYHDIRAIYRTSASGTVSAILMPLNTFCLAQIVTG